MFTERDVERLVREDAPGEDVTSKAVPEREASGELVAKEGFVAAGLEEAEKVFRYVGASFEAEEKDGEKVSEGAVLARTSGSSRDLLLAERPALNLVARMSGIATETSRAIRIAREVSGEVSVAATRKTAPGLRYLDKKAVEIGGGDPHRLNLSQTYLVKENHAAAAGGLVKAVKRVLERASSYRKVEVEAETQKEALEVASMDGVDIVLLDNFSPDEAAETVKRLDSKLGKDRPLVEASGGVTPDNLRSYAGHVDIISMGWLTHSSLARDVSFTLELD